MSETKLMAGLKRRPRRDVGPTDPRPRAVKVRALELAEAAEAQAHLNADKELAASEAEVARASAVLAAKQLAHGVLSQHWTLTKSDRRHARLDLADDLRRTAPPALGEFLELAAAFQRSGKNVSEADGERLRNIVDEIRTAQLEADPQTEATLDWAWDQLPPVIADRMREFALAAAAAA